MALKQNNLASSTTEQGFPTLVGCALQREETLEDGTKVIVEGITPYKMKNVLNDNAPEGSNITFRTPGEPYVTTSGETLNGICQTYNENHDEIFDIIKLGKSYKFKIKEKLDELDNMSLEEIAEFFEPADNRVAISDSEVTASSGNGNGILTSFMEDQGMPIIALVYTEDSKQKGLMYIPKCLTEIEGSPFYGETPGWYLSDMQGGFTPATVEEITINNVITLMNNYTGDASKLGDDLTEYDSSKLNWLLESAEEVEGPVPKLVSITATTQPVKSSYVVGETFDPTGMVITATFDDGSTKAVTDYTYSPTGALSLTDAKITVSYTENDDTRTAFVPISVVNLILTQGKTYEFDYKALAEYVEQQMITKGIMDEAAGMNLIGFSCGNQNPVIDVGTTNIPYRCGFLDCGVVQTQDANISFGTDVGGRGNCGEIDGVWDFSNYFSDLIAYLKEAGKVTDIYEFEAVNIRYAQHITINLQNCDKPVTYELDGNINWITQKD